MSHPPYWLTNQSVDTIDTDEYQEMWTEFVQILTEEEKHLDTPQHEAQLLTAMAKTWETGTLWYSLALQSPTGIFNIFVQKIQERLGKDKYDDNQLGLIMINQILDVLLTYRSHVKRTILARTDIPPQSILITLQNAVAFWPLYAKISPDLAAA
ncbi:hypothetical protein FQN57_007048 [Myotisia sp. PD_48]|nr:hypothetical protein FQN57_007048 [Myotisia sp. PD_48]